MRNLKKLFALFIVIGVLVVLASCGTSSGVKGVLTTKTVTPTKVVLTCSFDDNDNLKSKKATATVRRNLYVENGENEYQTTSNVTFKNDIYTSAEVEFSGLKENTKYVFDLYVKFESYDDKIYSLEVTTTDAGSTEDKAIKITTADEFNAIGEDVEAYYVLEKDIDFTGKTLSTGIEATTSKRFKGTFDGNGKTIKNVSLSSATYIGLFAYTDGATIKNLNLENITGDFSSGRATASIGALIGKAENTTIENVTINGVEFSIQGNTSAEINVGGVVGYADKTSFSNVKATVVDITLSRSRLKINAGLFAGVLTGKTTKNVDDVVTNVDLADKCSASGNITATLYYSSSSEGYTHIGGFSGDISSQSAVNDCYSDAVIVVTKDTASNYYNKFDFAVGGFLGCNNVSSTGLKITNCLANVNLSVYAGSVPTTDEEIATCNNTNLTTSDSKTMYYSYIGGFAGALYKYVSGISNCIYKAKDNEVTVYAKETQDITKDSVTTTETVLFKSNLIGKNKDEDTKITNLVEYSSAIDLSTFGDNVKTFLQQ